MPGGSGSPDHSVKKPPQVQHRQALPTFLRECAQSISLPFLDGWTVGREKTSQQRGEIHPAPERPGLLSPIR